MIIFLYGEDEFRSLEKLNIIKEKFLEKSSSSLVSGYFDFEEEKNINFSEIKKAFGSRGLFFEKQLVIVKNLLAIAPKETVLKMVDFLKSLKNIFDDNDLVIVFWEKERLMKKMNYLKF